MAALLHPADAVSVRVAGLELRLEANADSPRLEVPECHRGFAGTGGEEHRLTLGVRRGNVVDNPRWKQVFYDAETWQLWSDEGGNDVFVTSRHSPPPRQVTIHPAYRSGEIVGEFGAEFPVESFYPLKDIDMVIFANWLAKTGDFILHASGIIADGEAYVFAGHSGAGKSTLATELVDHHAVTVLGEDQVILRHQDGRFLAYGTPWHTNPARCSPEGAPLKKLFFLERGAPHESRPIPRLSGIELLMQNALIPYYNREGLERILDRLPLLAEQIPFHRLGFRIGADVMPLIRDA